MMPHACRRRRLPFSLPASLALMPQAAELTEEEKAAQEAAVVEHRRRELEAAIKASALPLLSSLNRYPIYFAGFGGFASFLLV